jgi:hypothetical protein
MKQYSSKKIQTKYEAKIDKINALLDDKPAWHSIIEVYKVIFSNSSKLEILGQSLSHIAHPFQHLTNLIKKEIADGEVKDMQVEAALQILCSHSNLEERNESAVCYNCGSYRFGWYCKDSPDNECHYFSEELEESKFTIELRDGSRFQLANDYSKKSQEYESDDDCLFCGNPEERK